MYKQVCTEGAPTYVVLGMAGAALDDETYYNKPWSVYHDQVFGYTHVAVQNSTHLYFAYHHNVVSCVGRGYLRQALTPPQDDAIADEFWIVKA